MGMRAGKKNDLNKEVSVVRTTQQVLESYREAVETNNVNKLMEGYEEDAILISSERTCVGKGTIQKEIEKNPMSIPEISLTFENAIIEADWVLIQWSVSAMKTTFPAVISVLLIQDGLIQRQAEWQPDTVEG